MDWLDYWYRRLRCSHPHIITLFTAEVFVNDRWERSSGVAECVDCGMDFHITVPANNEERDNLLWPN